MIAATHRLSVAATADQVVLLTHGRVRSVGRHAQLIRNDRLYRQLVTSGNGNADESG